MGSFSPPSCILLILWVCKTLSGAYGKAILMEVDCLALMVFPQVLFDEARIDWIQASLLFGGQKSSCSHEALGRRVVVR